MDSVSEHILKKYKLSFTLSRKKILDLFINSKYALIHSEIEKELHPLNRITTYRTLQVFLKKGIIHLVPSSNNSIKYALTKQDEKNKYTQKNHIHFFCYNCNKTVCLPQIIIPDIKLPKGYKGKYHDIIITGICSDCRLFQLT